MTDSEFIDPQINPFGLADVGSFSSPTFADLDDDGDLDAFIGEEASGSTFYFENIGDAGRPEFTNPVTDPFGLAPVGGGSNPEFVDIDGDGDLDAFVGNYPGGDIHFFENTGSATNPAFATATVNPFSLTNTGGFNSPTLVDIDGDGDLDAFIGNYPDGNTLFFENTGSTNSPTFAPPETNPFGLANSGTFSSPILVDIDGDDDLDAFIGAGDGNIIYFENTGSASNPTFTAATTSPFGLQNVGGYNNPTFADIDSDGDLDAFFGAADGQVHVFENIVIDVPITGSSDNDSLIGGDFSDIINGRAGNDTLLGSAGNDRIRGGTGSDSLNGGDGFDAIDYRRSTANITVDLLNSRASGGEAEGDDILNFERVFATKYDDILIGNADRNSLVGRDGNDTLIGHGGDDRIYGGTGADSLDGGDGVDTLEYLRSTAGVTVNLSTGLASGGDAEGDTILNVERVFGSSFDDHLTGDANDNVLLGREGNDTLIGGAGNDHLRGSIGADSLTGGSGVNVFIFGDLSDSLLAGFDVITDLKADSDRINTLGTLTASGAIEIGNVQSLSETDIQAELTTAQFAANDAVAFTFGSQTFLALNDDTAGFSATSDSIIEITGFSGSLDNLTIR